MSLRLAARSGVVARTAFPRTAYAAVNVARRAASSKSADSQQRVRFQMRGIDDITIY